ncbi:MAG: hypothetical protein ACRD5D_02775 [Candidatus Polarisedimenticolia bacterium]
MRRNASATIVAAILLAAPLPGCGSGAPGAAAGPHDPGAGGGSPARFASDPLWDDGRAEVNAYEARVRRYGARRAFTAYHIVVKEDLSREQLVKADPGHAPDDLVAVLKLNQILEFRTGVYTYNQMASTFHDRVSMDLLKFSLTSFEWCGNTFKEYLRRGASGTLHVHTYWDGMARADYNLPVGPDVFFYDELPLRLRALPQEVGTSLVVRLVPPQIESRAPRPEVRSAALRAVAEERVVVPAGAFASLRWELRAGDGAPESFWLGRAFPWPLLAWEKPDGGGLRLIASERLAYWELNRPGDEKRLPGRPAATPGR